MDDCIESDIVFKWTNCCRLCLTNDAEYDLFDPKNDTKCKTIILSLDLLIYRGDPMPRQLCVTCWDKVESWQIFRQKSLETENSLKKRLKAYRGLDFVQEYLNKDEAIKDALKSKSPESTTQIENSRKLTNEPADSTFFFGVPIKTEPIDSDEPVVNTTVASEPIVNTAVASEPIVNTTVAPEPGACIKIERVEQSPAEPPVPVKSSPSKPLIKVRTNLGCNNVLIPAAEDSRNQEGINIPICMNGELDTTSPITPSETQKVPPKNKKQNKACSNVNSVVNAESQKQKNGAGCGQKDDDGAEGYEIKTELHFPEGEDEVADCKMEPSSPDNVEYFDRSYNLRPRNETTVNYGETDWQVARGTTLPKPVTLKATPWKCDPCQIYFTARDAVKLHQNSAECKGYGLQNFPCRVCTRLFFDERDLAEHNLKHLRIAQNLTQQECRPCLSCKAVFADQLRFRAHVKLNHRKPTAPIPEWHCCGKIFTRKSVYDEHVLSHEKRAVVPEVLLEESRDFACSLCIERFKSEDLLYDHRFAMHGIPDERVACNICAKKFRTPVELEEHIPSHSHRAVARKSTSVPVAVTPSNVKCRRCGQNFSTRTLLLRHEAEKHKSLHNCVRCKRHFATRSLLLMHLRTHQVQKKKPMQVGQYHITAEGTSDLPAPDPKQIANLICSMCDLQFGCHEDVALHISTHSKAGLCPGRIRHNLKHVYSYQCEGCPQMFLDATNFHRHAQFRHFGASLRLVKTKCDVKRAGLGIQSPAPDDSFPCTQCSAVFQSAAVLNFHVRKKHLAEATNSEETVYENCKICHKRYSVNYIHKHMWTDHATRSKRRRDDRDYVSTRKKLYKCQYCKKSCSTEYNLKKHEQGHDPATGDFKCRCGAMFKTQELAQDHKKQCGIKSVWVTKKPALRSSQDETCNVCFQSYETPQLLQLHVSTAHGLGVPTENPSKELWREESNKIIRKVNGVLRCTLCRLRFDNNEEVSWHQGQHARGNAYIIQLDECLFQCTVCGKLFKQREDGLSHISEHAEPEIPTSSDVTKKYNCPFCSQKFTREESIRSHIHSQHPGDSSKRTF